MAPDAVEFDGSSSSFKKVCVMGAGGCFGSALVHHLLQRGYFVHAAVNTQVEMQSMNADGKNLRVFHTDPLDYHSILKALEGCYGLFYSFEPPSDQPFYDESMAEMEVRAAHNVLEACAQTDTIDKVVFTSSASAVIWRDPSDSSPSSSDVDERNWSNVNFCKKFKLWYGLSKTLAEKTAWALAMDRGCFCLRSILCFNHVVNCNEDAVKLAKMLLPPDVSSLTQYYSRGEQDGVTKNKQQEAQQAHG
ncbi:hypothetical protein E3N88_43545 [Mikania micrantha]|uniref:NAD-dependent epimerase/dehydratase domain-containing protein n=1 Tax=Mikania micrantha TaxID=192012 RepID=A0A5N6LER2_9ASTR|nr:hypothetical protein E3N88_43545 [Mikania micrantha]